MLRQQKKLACLQEELRTLALLDRVLDYSLNPDPADNLAHASRELRRSQIEAEIRKLSPSKPEYANHTRIASAALLLCVVGYLTLHYFLK
jgi:hypothetical protein